MAIASSLCLVTPRDQDLFQALERSPLTVRQLLKLSSTFSYPFTTERRVQERLQRLVAAGRVRRWRYATAGQGALSYYTLRPLGYRLLHGLDAVAPGRGLFSAVGVARQAHTQALAEVIVHFLVSAHRSGIEVIQFQRENGLRLSVGDDSLYPDGAFALQATPETRFSYFVELDNRTESVRASGAFDSWERKVQFYERYQDAQPERFRVLTVTTGGPERLQHILQCAADLARNPRRSLVYGISCVDLLSIEDPLRNRCFQNHLGEPVALLPSVPVQREFLFDAAAGGGIFRRCLRPHAEV